MKNLIAFLLLVLLVGGCETDQAWIHPSSKPVAEAKKDMDACKNQAERSIFVPYSSGSSHYSSAMQEKFRKEQLYKTCMTGKGYYLADKQSVKDQPSIQKEYSDDWRNANRKEDYDKALEVADKLIAQHPYSPQGYLVRGYTYFEIEKYRQALSDFNRALSMPMDAKSAARATGAKALCFAELAEFDAALGVVNQRISMNPKGAWFYDIRAYVFNKKGDYDRALQDCSKSLAIDIGRPEPYKNRGLAYLGKLEFEKAVEQFDKALSIEPSYSHAYDGRGEAYLKMGMDQKALTDFRKACELRYMTACSKVKRFKGAD